MGGVLTLFIAAPPNGSSVWVCVVDEVAEAAFEQEVTADMPTATLFLSPRLFMNNGTFIGSLRLLGGQRGVGLLTQLFAQPFTCGTEKRRS